MAESKNKPSWCAVIPLRQLVALPGTSIVLDIGRELSKTAVNKPKKMMVAYCCLHRFVQMMSNQLWMTCIRSGCLVV